MKKRIIQFVVVCLFLGLLATSPIWLMIVGSFLQNLMTDTPCTSEANCVWVVLPWYLPFSLFLSFMGFCLYTIYFIFSIIVSQHRK